MTATTASEPPANPAAIAQLEAQLGVTLPDEFADFLKRSNGGRIEPYLIKLPDGNISVLNRFYGVHPGVAYDIGGSVAISRDDMPDELIPVGEDPGGDLICLAVKGDHAGAVYYQYHDHEADVAPPFSGFDNLLPVAGSFGAFLAELYEDDSV